jgi:two-component system, OmpR family, response regulator
MTSRADARPCAPRLAMRDRAAHLGRMRILLVEDDARLADLLARSLREQGHAVDLSGDGEHALVQASVNAYDCLVLDVGLPRRDGVAVAQALRARGDSVPILMLTARDAVSDRIRGLDAGADDYVPKPVDLAELHARLRALMRRGPQLAPAMVTVGDLAVDTHAQRVTRAGRELSLTTKEYVLLEYLARHAGRVVGRAELSEHVWDENHDPTSNAIDVYIARLRRKLEADGGAPLIQTRRGAGYRLAADERSTTPGA